MLIEDPPVAQHFKIISLITQFWLSGLFILGIIFTASPNDIENLTLYMFLSLAVGSILGGILCDFFNRFSVFKTFFLLLSFASLLCLINTYIGHIVAAFCIGPLNNITFVIITQNFPSHKEKYITFVLVGWAFSEMTLGIFFAFSDNTTLFYFLAFMFSVADTIAVFLFFDNRSGENNHIENQQEQEEWWVKIIPTSWKHLLGGCLLMFVMQMFYYRTQFTLDQFGISLWLNTFIVGFAELFANLFFGKYFTEMKRKKSLRILLCFLILLFILLMLTKNKLLQTIIEGIMRLGDAGIMLVLGIYLPELFLESERGKGVSFIMSFGVIGSALNQKILSNFPFWFLAIFLGLAFLSTILLKETQVKDNPLDQEQDNYN